MKVDEGGNPDFVTELNPTDVNLLVESALPYCTQIPSHESVKYRMPYSMGASERTSTPTRATWYYLESLKGRIKLTMTMTIYINLTSSIW